MITDIFLSILIGIRLSTGKIFKIYPYHLWSMMFLSKALFV